MLQGITPARSVTSSRNAVDLLTDCHQKIRHFTQVVQKLAHAEGSPLPEISAAAEGAYRYFTVSLPLHEADEEEIRACWRTVDRRLRRPSMRCFTSTKPSMTSSSVYSLSCALSPVILRRSRKHMENFARFPKHCWKSSKATST
jgi:hypothetical protein